MKTEINWIIDKNNLIPINEVCNLGFDEAGRGPVLGPMVFSIAIISLKGEAKITKLAYIKDSKKLSPKRREIIYNSLLNNQEVAWCTIKVPPEEICDKKNAVKSINLNMLSYLAINKLIDIIIGYGYKINKFYVDTVGPSFSLFREIKKKFPSLDVIVLPKADEKFIVVSLASIISKFFRDYYMKEWIFLENGIEISKNFGSGYPSDPLTVNWMKKSHFSFFGFPRIVRFTYKTVDKFLDYNLAWRDKLKIESLQIYQCNTEDWIIFFSRNTPNYST